jgi:hypothetical protein
MTLIVRFGSALALLVVFYFLGGKSSLEIAQMTPVPTPGVRFIYTPPPVSLSPQPISTPVTDSTALRVIVVLEDAPVVRVYLDALASGQSLTAAWQTAATQGRHLRDTQAAFVAGLSDVGIQAVVISTTTYLVNSITLEVASNDTAPLWGLPGVVAVIVDRPVTQDAPLAPAADVMPTATGAPSQ